MATHAHHHESHGNHPMSLVGFVLGMLGGLFSAMWVITLADLPDNKPTNIAYGIVALACLASTVVIFNWLTRHLHHSPMVPDNTPAEITRYRQRLGKS